VCLSPRAGLDGARRPKLSGGGPLKSRFPEDSEPPTVWSNAEGKVRSTSLVPLYKTVPKAALRESKFRGVPALCDVVRSGRTRERNLAVELLKQEMNLGS